MDNMEKRVGSNMGGVLAYWFVLVSDVLVVTKSSIGASVTLKDGCVWSEGVGTRDSIGYKEPGEPTGAGTVYKAELVAMVPQEGLNELLFERMRHGRYLVRYKNAQGLEKLVGTMDEPLNFSEALDTKQVVTALAGSGVRFWGDMTKKAVLYISG